MWPTVTLVTDKMVQGFDCYVNEVACKFITQGHKALYSLVISRLLDNEDRLCATSM
jgi:hypothetical protein